MRHFKIITFAVVLFTVCTAFTFPFLKAPSHKVYGFGIAASFKDTVVYFTEIQELDSAIVDSKGFLKSRPAYSQQLKSYLEDEQKLAYQTCMIYFSKDKDQLRKKENKLRKVYMKDKSIVIQNIASTAFHFTKPQDSSDEAVTVQ